MKTICQCDRCSGTGEIECPDCDGTGEMDLDDALSLAVDDPRRAELLALQRDQSRCHVLCEALCKLKPEHSDKYRRYLQIALDEIKSLIDELFDSHP